MYFHSVWSNVDVKPESKWAKATSKLMVLDQLRSRLIFVFNKTSTGIKQECVHQYTWTRAKLAVMKKMNGLVVKKVQLIFVKNRGVVNFSSKVYLEKQAVFSK